ncbi:RNA-binding family protein isoform 1 [Hibiscus syriacus]|uniref:RNA-binding family protein isoform 1 n=1 Tax=Hibiscus syriacus TaxID=106335 RepID=A0A6A3BXB7_HIBSY|nr:RNA-binding family protein isoform 1 [Hibiscus syriacus]
MVRRKTVICQFMKMRLRVMLMLMMRTMYHAVLDDREEHDERHAVFQERRKRKEFVVFVGGLEKDATEDDIRKVFSQVGEVVEVRLTMNPQTKKNKGFAFLCFATIDQAKRAFTEPKSPVINGKQCGVTQSQDSDTLFLGNVCRTWTKEAHTGSLPLDATKNVYKSLPFTKLLLGTMDELAFPSPKGIEHLDLWGDSVKWGSDFKLNSSKECCDACKDMCKGDDGPCLCDSWVFCGDKVACGSRFGECWLKKQNDTLEPDQRDSGDMVMWTSGLIFGKGQLCELLTLQESRKCMQGIVKLNTEFGGFHVKLLPCAPYSVFYILELLSLHHCAESRGNSWDPTGNHIEHDIPPEACPTIRRGSIAWVGSGPEFFISLANHNEWRKAYTVFGYVLPKDMEMVEKISQLPTYQMCGARLKCLYWKDLLFSYESYERRNVLEIPSDAKCGHQLKVQHRL